MLQSASEGCIDHFTHTLSRETVLGGGERIVLAVLNRDSVRAHTRTRHNAYNAHVNTSLPDSIMHNHVNLQVK